MQRFTSRLVLFFLAFHSSVSVLAQNDTIPVSVNPALLEILSSKYPKSYTIGEISVTGTQSFDPTLIVSISGLAVGDKLLLPGSDVFGKAIAKLWKQSLVSNAVVNITKLEGSSLSVEIAITERPRLISFSFEGVKKSEKEDLENKIGLSKDKVLTENMKLSAVEAIEKFYYEKGYRNVTIKLNEDIISGISNGVSLVFLINKGGKVKINNVNFSGNQKIEDAKLKKQMKGTKEMARFSLYPQYTPSAYGDVEKRTPFSSYLSDLGFLTYSKTINYLDPYFRPKFFSSSKFNEKKYLEDKEKVLEYYNSRGLRDAELVADTQMVNSKGNLDIDILVSEGRQYFFGDISWKGNTKYSDSLLNFLLGINKGDVYNIDQLNKRLGKQLSMEGGDISSLYQDDGYLFFRIDPIETAVYNDTIDFEIRIAEGPQATYGKITVSGNDKTKDHVIIREMRTRPGEKFSRADIIRTQRELSQLGYFNPEKINPNIIPNADNGTVDVNWEVEEKSSDQLELSAGFGGGIGLTGTLGVTFNNFSINNITSKSTWDPLPSGDGQKLSLRAQSNGRAYRSYNFSFTEPWLGGKKRNSFSINYFNTKFSNSFSPFGGFCRSCGDTSYLKTVGFGISLGKQLKWPDDYFNLIYSFNVQQYKLRNYAQIFSGLSNGNSTNISLKVSLLRNSAGPNPIFPSSGSNFALTSQFTLPYSLLGMTDGTENKFEFPEFHKWKFSGDWYTPIGRGRGADKNKQFILRAAAKFGFIGRYNNKLEISPFERFQVGDAGLSNTQALLGYDIIAHRGYPVYSNSNPKVSPEGVTPTQYFTIYNKYIVELRYPFSTNASSTIFGLAFYEAANGWYSFKEYNPFKLRRSVGLGMRFFLPMFGLLGFDYGIGIDRFNQSTGIKGAAKFTFMLGQEAE
jgi:outer membrane protein insertion porin family